MFASVFSRMVIIFMVLFVGALARWRKVLTQETTYALSRLVMELTLPFLYFYTLSTGLTRQLFSAIFAYPLYAIILTVFFFILSWLISLALKIERDKRRTFMFLVTFPNYGFLAIPLVFALFGEDGLVKIFMFNLGITFLYWTLGVAILSGPELPAKRMWLNLANPSLAALFLGLFFGTSSLKPPQFILESAKLIGVASIPLALMVVGSLLAQGNFAKHFSGKLIFALLFSRLILIPGLITLLLKSFLDLPQVIGVIIILQAALPSASTTPILVKRFGGDEELSAQGVFFTTLFSILTIPLFISLALR